jgi:hypothetical protein
MDASRLGEANLAAACSMSMPSVSEIERRRGF